VRKRDCPRTLSPRLKVINWSVHELALLVIEVDKECEMKVLLLKAIMRAPLELQLFSHPAKFERPPNQTAHGHDDRGPALEAVEICLIGLAASG